MNTASFAAAAACVLFAAKANATFGVESESTIVVSYNDLNLGSKAGQAELRHRLHVAALHVCSIDRFLSLDCYQDAIVEALREADRAIKMHDARLPTTTVRSTPTVPLLVTRSREDDPLLPRMC